ncbi:MAG: hypothetical protein FD167_5706, partial [bacterium]
MLKSMKSKKGNKSQYKSLIQYIVAYFCLLLVIGIKTSAQQSGGRVFTGNTKIKTNPTPPKADPRPKVDLKPKSVQEKLPEKPKAPEGLKIPELVPIAPGVFTMGSSAPRPEEKPMHSIELDTFEISKYEVTNKEYEIFAISTSYLTQAEK